MKHSISCVFLVLCAFTLDASQAGATESSAFQRFVSGDDEGFYLPNSEQVPTAVRNASERVYRIVFALRNRDPKWRISQDELLAKRAKVDEALQSGKRKSSTLRLAAVADGLQDCSENPATGKTTCANIYVLGNCSSFATHAGTRVWTNAHCVSGARASLEGHVNDPKNGEHTKAFVKDSDFVIYLFDRNLQKVAGPVAVAPSKVDLLKYPYVWSVDQIANDLISFETPGQKIPSLEWSESVPRNSQEVFIAGYPMITGPEGAKANIDYADMIFRSRQTGRDSNGLDLFVSKGLILDPTSLNRVSTVMENPEEYTVYQSEYAKTPQTTFVTTADAINGNSGGPAIDAQGRVLGIFSTYVANKMRAQDGARNMSVFVRPPLN